jgi:hypothetical protein
MLYILPCWLGNLQKSLTVFRPKQASRPVNFISCGDSLIITVCSAMLYDMQHSLVLVRVSLLLTSKILHNVYKVQYPLNFVMVLWVKCKWLQEWFGGVRCWYVDTQDQDLVGAMGVRKKRALNFWHSFQPAITSIDLSVTTVPLTDSHFCVWSSNHTHKICSLRSQEMFALRGALALTLSWAFLYSSRWNDLSVHLHHNGVLL